MLGLNPGSDGADGEDLFNSRAIRTVKSVWIEDWPDETNSVWGGFFLHVCQAGPHWTDTWFVHSTKLPTRLSKWPTEILPGLCLWSSTLPRQHLLPEGHLCNLSTWRSCYFLNLSRKNVLLTFAQRYQITSPVFIFTNVSIKLPTPWTQGLEISGILLFTQRHLDSNLHVFFSPHCQASSFIYIIPRAYTSEKCGWCLVKVCCIEVPDWFAKGCE